MDMLHNLTLGFSVALRFQNLLYALVGCTVGTLIGVLPGIGPVATIAMLLPITFHLPPTASLIMLAGIYYGAQYGGSTTSILVNLPGEASSVVTCLDGYQMARKGRAGAALSISAMPNRPIAMGAKSMPSLSSGMSKVKRCAPVLTSVPTRPNSRPRNTMAIALVTEPFASTTAATRPNAISEQ